ncbi:MAG: Putative permease often clustered with de novo purine synthesis [uncultured Thiotrichaceae bacterium]|uniref:Permease often clustered with de novo purine synthesis n=1 Tax=uncultured Thiotrichaceae bacterium TaxID=298394 RepID=A0A6S6UD94_9GAMM|nr:MAG: Putative permease often clustered with de novo purine synthesis [uncultured Thiotrichaceae bacterium]
MKHPAQDRRWFWLVIALLTFSVLYLLAPILTPFVVGLLLAYLGDPVVDRLEKKKVPRTLGVSVVFLIFFIIFLLIFLLLVPVLETQLKILFTRIPDYIDASMGFLQPFLMKTIGVDIAVLEVERLKEIANQHWAEAGGIIRSLVSTISQSSMVIIAWIANIALTPVITFYMLRDWDNFVAYINDLLPRTEQPMISRLAKESDEVLGGFLRGQLMVMLALGTIYSIGLWMVGVDLALLIGMTAGILSFVPYLGLVIGVVIAGFAVLFQTGDMVDLMLVFLVFIIAQMIEGILLTPLLVGERIGLHPVTVIFAVLAGGQLFGFFGVLLALPVAAILGVIMRHLHDSYKSSQIYQL